MLGWEALVPEVEKKKKISLCRKRKKKAGAPRNPGVEGKSGGSFIIWGKGSKRAQVSYSKKRGGEHGVPKEKQKGTTIGTGNNEGKMAREGKGGRISYRGERKI